MASLYDLAEHVKQSYFDAWSMRSWSHAKIGNRKLNWSGTPAVGFVVCTALAFAVIFLTPDFFPYDLCVAGALVCMIFHWKIDEIVLIQRSIRETNGLTTNKTPVEQAAYNLFVKKLSIDNPEAKSRNIELPKLKVVSDYLERDLDIAGKRKTVILPTGIISAITIPVILIYFENEFHSASVVANLIVISIAFILFCALFDIIRTSKTRRTQNILRFLKRAILEKELTESA